MPQLNLTSRLDAFLLTMLVLVVLVLQGCGSGSSSDSAVLTGYYDTGTASVIGAADIADLQALINGDRLMMMSTVNGLLYDGAITDITENSFTANVTVYENGENTGSAIASGTIEGSSIDGTLTGSGFGSGSFNLTYASSNSHVADLSRVENTEFYSWRGEGLVSEFDFEINGEGIVADDNFSGSGSLYDSCEMSGTITPVSSSNLYSVNVTLRTCENDEELNGDYTGLATTIDDSGVDRLVYMISNTAYAYFGGFYED